MHIHYTIFYNENIRTFNLCVSVYVFDRRFFVRSLKAANTNDGQRNMQVVLFKFNSTLSCPLWMEHHLSKSTMLLVKIIFYSLVISSYIKDSYIKILWPDQIYIQKNNIPLVWTRFPSTITRWRQKEAIHC